MLRIVVGAVVGLVGLSVLTAYGQPEARLFPFEVVNGRARPVGRLCFTAGAAFVVVAERDTARPDMAVILWLGDDDSIDAGELLVSLETTDRRAVGVFVLPRDIHPCFRYLLGNVRRTQFFELLISLPR